MTPSAETDILARCLVLQPTVGWPIWDGADPGKLTGTVRHRLFCVQYADPDDTAWVLQYELTPEDWRFATGFGQGYEAVCIMQAHLLRWLAERSPTNFAALSDGKWIVAVCGGPYSNAHDTLMEALIDVCEQIAKEQSDA